VIPGLVALAFLVVPLAVLLWQAPWGSFAQILSSPSALEALRLSLTTSITATAFATLVGIPLAWLLVVSGVALLAAFGRHGAVGQFLYSWFGVQLPFTTAGVVLAQAFVAMPFLVITLEGAFRSLDRRYEDAAVTLGASTWTVFRRVTLPLVGPSLMAGAVLCWARALGEFGATITFAGNFPGVTQTMPLAVYTALESDRSVAIALSVLLLAVCVGVLIALRGRYLRPMAPA
jgi:molybdate transport system permease protein